MAARQRASAAAPGVAEAVAYAEAVVAGRVPAGRLARLACERFLRDKAAADAGAGPWGFEPDLVEAALLFAGQMPNIKGPEAGRPLRLMPWQRFVFANLFGFVERGTATRRFRQAVVYVPRGNGKTTLAAPIGLYLTFVEGEGGAEGYAAAVTRDQARILFDAAQNMVRRSPEFRAAFGVGVGANAIYQERTASRFAPVSSDAKALDGLNVQVAVCDEIASHKTSEVYDVLLTAMGKRRHPLLLSISTATGNNTGIGKQLWDYAGRVLDGTPGGRAPVRAGPRRRSGGRPLGRGDLDQGQPVLGPSRPARRHPRHHAPGQEQPRPGGGGQDAAPEPLGRGGRGALLHAGLARGGRSLARAGGLRGPGLPPRARPCQPDRPCRARHRLPRARSGHRQGHATPPSRAAT